MKFWRRSARAASRSWPTIALSASLTFAWPFEVLTMADENKLREMMNEQEITRLLLASNVLAERGYTELACQVREAAQGMRADVETSNCAGCENTGRTP